MNKIKQFTFKLVGLLFLASVSNAGLITHNDYTAGNVITAAGQNTNENTIVNEFNGNIESANIKDGTIVTGDIATGGVTTTNILDGTIVYADLNAVIVSSITGAFNTLGYRRPVLQYQSATVVNLETGINGTSGQAVIVFPDGTKLTDSTSGRINCDFTRNAVLSGGGAQSGLRSGLTVAAGQWYALYATKVTGSTTNFIVVGDTIAPTTSEYPLLNTNYGTNGWVYLGTLPAGDNVSGTSIPVFRMAGNMIELTNEVTTAGNHVSGYRYNNSASASTLSISYTGGMAAGNVPKQFIHCLFKGTAASGTTTVSLNDGTSTSIVLDRMGAGGGDSILQSWYPPFNGINLASSSAVALSLAMSGYTDVSLGGGSLPIL